MSEPRRPSGRWTARTVVGALVPPTPSPAPAATPDPSPTPTSATTPPPTALPAKGKTAIWNFQLREIPLHTTVQAPRIQLPFRSNKPEAPAPARNAPTVIIQVAADPSSEPSSAVDGLDPAVARSSRSKRRVSRASAPARTSSVRRAWAYLRREFEQTSIAIRCTLVVLPAIAWLTLKPWPTAVLVSTPSKPEILATPAATVSAVASRPLPPPPLPAVEEDVAPSEQIGQRLPSVAPAPALRQVEPTAPSPALATHAAESRSGSSLEARAADAAARGDSRAAVALYLQLAQLHPERPEFASAARILSRR